MRKPTPAPPGAEILVAGAGVDPVRDLTLETLEALAACSPVFVSVKNPAHLDWLRRLLPEARPAASPAEVAAAALKGRRVAVVVWSHPRFSSRFTAELQKHGRARGVPVRMLPCVSPIGKAISEFAVLMGGHKYGTDGMEALEVETVLGRPERAWVKLPTVVYAENAAPERWNELFRVVRKEAFLWRRMRLWRPGVPIAPLSPRGPAPAPPSGPALLYLEPRL